MVHFIFATTKYYPQTCAGDLGRKSGGRFKQPRLTPGLFLHRLTFQKNPLLKDLANMKKYTYSKPYKKEVNYTVTFENGHKTVIKAKSRLEAINSKEMLQLQLTYGFITSVKFK